jgi:hypothetical protein
MGAGVRQVHINKGTIAFYRSMYVYRIILTHLQEPEILRNQSIGRVL